MKITAQDQTNLHTNVASNLNQAGQNVTTSDLNPDDQTPLEQIKQTLGDTAHIVGATVGETVGDEVVLIRSNNSKGWKDRIFDRAKRMIKK